MDLKQLATFIEVAERGSLSKASDKLRIAQPALGRHIRLLETELNTILFSRHGRGMVLTEAGALFLTRAKAILSQVEETRLALADYGGDISGSVVVGVPPTVSDVLAGRLAERFVVEYPKVTLRIVTAFSTYLLDFLHTGKVDIAVMFEDDLRLNARVLPLLVENLFLIEAAGSSRLSLHKPVTFKSVAARRLILPGRPHGLRSLAEREALRQNLRLSVPIEADSLQTLKDLVIRGLGSTILSMPSVHLDIAAGRLVAAPISEPRLSRKLVLAEPLGRPLSNAVQRFSTLLRAEIATMVKSKIWDGKLLK